MAGGTIVGARRRRAVSGSIASVCERGGRGSKCGQQTNGFVCGGERRATAHDIFLLSPLTLPSLAPPPPRTAAMQPNQGPVPTATDDDVRGVLGS